MNIAFFGKNSKPVRAFLGRCDKIKAPVKPYDAEVEWIESTGTQWIDTGVFPKLNTISRFRIIPREETGLSLYGVLQSDDDNDYRFFNLQGRAWLDAFGDRAVTGVYVRPFPYGTWYEIELGNHYVKNIETQEVVCSKPVATSTAHLPGFPITLNHAVWDGTATNSKSGWGYVTIIEDSNVIRDMIPVRFTNELGQSEGAMYDKVSKQLFRNQGEGSFVIGPDKWTNPYVTDGLVAMWDGEWNAGGGIHDANATTWKDLIGNNDLTLAGTAAFGSAYLSVDYSSQVYSSSPITTVGTLEMCLSRTDLRNDICLFSLASLGGLNMQNFVSWYNSKLGFSATDATTNVCFTIEKQWAACTIAFVPASVGAYVNGHTVSMLSEKFYYSGA